MKKHLLIVLLLCFAKIKAQYIAIPDPHFASYLQSVIPNAINGNQLDTTNSNVTNLVYISVGSHSISSLSGLQYFTGLTSIDCSNNQLTTLPKLPPALQYLQCSFNQLTSLPVLPSSLVYLQANGNLLNTLPALPDSLYGLYCYNNHLSSLPTLPHGLVDLYCYNNQLTTLPALPDSLKNLYCSHNQLTSLPTLPNLNALMCNNNNITCFPTFPNTFQIGYNGSGIPYSTFSITANPFTCLPNYVDMMDSATLAYPLCAAGNSNGCAVVSSINQPSNNNQLNIYPNPALNNFVIETLNNEIQTLQIFDVHGELVLLQTIQGKTIFSTENISQGVYNISITGSSGTINKRLLIIK